MVADTLIYILCVTSVAYLTRVFLFDGSTGPFESNTKVVVEDGTYEGFVDLWDRVRQIFGVYRVEDAGNGIENWHTTIRVELWKCPKCLSFWVSFLASVPFTLFIHEYALFPIVHLSITFMAQFLVFLQLRIEGD